jgi:hypothetical protein
MIVQGMRLLLISVIKARFLLFPLAVAQLTPDCLLITIGKPFSFAETDEPVVVNFFPTKIKTAQLNFQPYCVVIAKPIKKSGLHKHVPGIDKQRTCKSVQ